MGRLAPRDVASGYGIGYAPVAPGTLASFAALIVGGRLGVALPVAAIAASVAGTLALRRIPEAADDPGWVVVDEIAGQWIAMLGLGRRPQARGLLAAFALFRLLDILKPGPIGWADRKRGPLGVMGDDIIAGAIAAVALRLVRRWL